MWEWAGWSAPELFANPRRQVFLRWGPNKHKRFYLPPKCTCTGKQDCRYRSWQSGLNASNTGIEYENALNLPPTIFKITKSEVLRYICKCIRMLLFLLREYDILIWLYTILTCLHILPNMPSTDKGLYKSLKLAQSTLTHKAPPTIGSRRQFHILPLFQK